MQASSTFTVERNGSGEAVKLVGKGKLTLSASKYMQQLDLDISLGPDGSSPCSSASSRAR